MHIECRGPKMPKTTRKKKKEKKVGGLTLSDLMTDYKVIVSKTVWN